MGFDAPLYYLHQHGAFIERQPVVSVVESQRVACDVCGKYMLQERAAIKVKRLTRALQNIIPTAQSAVQLVSTVGFSILSDYLRSRPAVMSISTFFGFFTSLLLAIWTIPAGLKWFSFFASRISVAYGPLSMTWANEICGADAEERAVVLGIMNAAGYAFNAWLPLLTYPVVDSPRFRKGFIYTTIAFVAQAVITWTIWLLSRRDRKKEKSTIVAAGVTQEL